LAFRHFGRWLGLFVEHLVCNPKPKGLRTLFKSAQPPAKKHKKPTKQSQGTIREWNCALKIKKMEEKFGFFGGDWVSEFWGKWGKRGKWGWNGGFEGVWEKKDGDGGEKWGKNGSEQ
jgi:hypothetical protein